MKTTLLFLSVILIARFGFCQSTATYDITFTSTWNAGEHSSVPSDAHWSNLVGATHKNSNVYFEETELASLGIKDVAEQGDNGAIMSEILASPDTKQYYNEGFDPNVALATTTISDVEFTEEHHMLTLVSMIAPSPDWFIGVNSLDLRNAGNTDWKGSFEIDVFAYDAGTDNGVNYDSSNSPNTPVPISLITGFPINGYKMGTLTVTFIQVLGLPEASLDQIKLFPNPAKDVLNISNYADKDLELIELYNILGKKMLSQTVTDNQSRLSLNLRSLQSGIYILKLENGEGHSSSRKVIID